MSPEGALWVRMPRFIGDAMMIAQSLEPLRSRGIPLVAWGPGPVMDLFEGSSYFQGVSADEAGKRGAFHQASLLKRHQASGVLNFGRSQRGLLAAWLARVPLRLGWREGGGWLFATHSLRFREPGHQMDRYRALLDMGFPGQPPEPSGPFHPRDEARSRATALVESLGIRGAHAVIAFGAAADIKRVGARVWAGLASELEARGMAVFFLGGPLDRDHLQAEDLRGLLPRARILCGETGLAVSAALLDGADICFANDSAMAHIAAACHRPTVVAFGPTDPRRTRPQGPAVAAAWNASLDCLACGSFTCRRGDHACMQALDPGRLLRCAAEVLPKDGPIHPVPASHPRIEGHS